MGQSGIPHRLLVGLGDRPTVAAGESGRDGARRAAQLRPHMLRQPPLQRREQWRALGRLEYLDRPLHAPRGGITLEPGRTREVVAAGEHRRSGRHQSRLEPNDRAFAKGRLVLLQRHVDPDLYRPPRRLACRQDQTNAIVGRLLDPLEHLAGDDHRPGPLDRLGADQL
jgi:hypothetical protein